MELQEIKEIIVRSYSKTFDKKMAYKKAGLSNADIIILEEDEEFQERLDYYLIEAREKYINNLKTFMDSENEKIAYEATLKMSELIYPDFFEPLNKPKDVNVNLNPGQNSKEEDDRIREEYGELLQDPGKFIKAQIVN